MKEQFSGNPERALIELRNRVLDQIRFEAVKSGGLTEEMIDKQFDTYGYQNSSLKKELLAAYRQVQHKGESVPQYPSEAFIKGSAAIKREHAYIDKQNAAIDIATNLRKLHESEMRQGTAAHSMNLEKQDIEANRETSQQEKEQEIKDKYMDIPSGYRAEVRPQAAEALRESRHSYGEAQERLERDTEKIKNWQAEGFEDVQQGYKNEVEKATNHLQEARVEFDKHTDIEEPTNEEWKTYSKEERGAWDEKVNNVILSFKKNI